MVENGRETLAGETLEEICPYDDRPVSPGGDSMTSSLECDLMIESLQRELDMVRLELEAIVLQQIPRAAINTGAGGGGEGEERPIGRNATDNVKVALINRGAGINKMQQKISTVHGGVSTGKDKNKSEISKEKEQYYVNLVSEWEKEKARIRKQRFFLLAKHISNQLVMLQQKADKLDRKLQQRIARDKAMSLPPKPVRTRSNLSLLPQLPNVYKSSFYKAAADEHLANKIRRQAPVVKKQYQPPPLPKPKAEKGPHSATGGSCPLPPVNKRGSRYSVTSDGAGLVEGSDMWSDRSNSWAITEIPPAKPLGPKGKVDIPTCTSAPYPDLTPLDSLVSLARQRELEEAHIRLHHKRMAQLANNRRMMMHMYHLSKLHAQIFAASNFKTIDERVLLAGRESATPTSRPLSAKSTENMLSLESVSSSSLSQLPTSSSSAAFASPSDSQHLPRISPAPFLSLDEEMQNSPNIKESKKMSSLWKNYTK